VIQADALKAQRKALGADRTKLNTRTPGLVQTGTPLTVNRKRTNQWSLSSQPTRKLRVVSTVTPPSRMEREIDDEQSGEYSPTMSSSSSFSSFTSSSGAPALRAGVY
jgi:hypothetical protein